MARLLKKKYTRQEKENIAILLGLGFVVATLADYRVPAAALIAGGIIVAAIA